MYKVWFRNGTGYLLKAEKTSWPCQNLMGFSFHTKHLLVNVGRTTTSQITFMKLVVFWDFVRCSLTNNERGFRGSYRCHRQGGAISHKTSIFERYSLPRECEISPCCIYSYIGLAHRDGSNPIMLCMVTYTTSAPDTVTHYVFQLIELTF